MDFLYSWVMSQLTFKHFINNKSTFLSFSFIRICGTRKSNIISKKKFESKIVFTKCRRESVFPYNLSPLIWIKFSFFHTHTLALKKKKTLDYVPFIKLCTQIFRFFQKCKKKRRKTLGFPNFTTENASINNQTWFARLNKTTTFLFRTTTTKKDYIFSLKLNSLSPQIFHQWQTEKAKIMEKKILTFTSQWWIWWKKKKLSQINKKKIFLISAQNWNFQNAIFVFFFRPNFLPLNIWIDC